MQASDPVSGEAFRSILWQPYRQEETSPRKTDGRRKAHRLPNRSDGPPRRMRSHNAQRPGDGEPSRRPKRGCKTNPHARMVIISGVYDAGASRLTLR